MPCDYRHPDDDFYCFRFGVWYRAVDCAFRTMYQTSESCEDCLQGMMNLIKFGSKLQSVRGLYPGIKPFTPSLEAVRSLQERLNEKSPAPAQRKTPRAIS